MNGTYQGIEQNPEGQFVDVDKKVFAEELRERRDRSSVTRRLEIGFAMLSDDYESGKEEVTN